MSNLETLAALAQACDCEGFCAHERALDAIDDMGGWNTIVLKQAAEITRLREQLAEAQMKSLADLGQAQDAWEAQKDAERQRDAARAEALDDGLKRAAEHRATFCTAMPGTDEEFRAYLDGFDAAIRALIKEDRT